MALAASNKILYLPPPTGGINAIDPFANMPQSDAVALVNIAPKENYSEVRKAFELLGTSAAIAGINNGTYKIWPLALSSGTTSFLVHGSVLSWSVTSAGVWSPMLAPTTPNAMNFCQFKSLLFGAGGSGTPKSYDGTTTFINSGWTGTGLTASNLETPWVYKDRLFFTEANSRNTWYGDIDQTTGAAKALTKFPLDSKFHKGGFGYFGGSSVPQEGRDTEALWVCVSSEGEILVYTGQDPAAADWAFYGRYYISPPLARNSFFYIGGVLHIQTRTGINSLNDIIAGKKDGANYVSLSKKIDPLLSQYYPTQSDYQVNQTGISVRENLLYVKVFITNIGEVAYVMNLITGAWSQYRIYSAVDSTPFSFLSGFCGIGSDMYFITQGASGATIALWKVGQDYIYDKWGSGGSDRKDIHWSIQHAFTSGNQNTNKKFNKVRPIIQQQAALTIGSYSDFDTTLASQSVATSLTMNKKFYDINKEGFYLSLYLAGDSNDASATTLPQYHGSLLSYEPGSNVP